MIYDGFIFFNEFELLEIRLNELWDVVDKFILVEADTTHSGKPKPMWFRERKAEFEKYWSKIVHVEVRDMPKTTVTWDREIHQRNCILRGVDKTMVRDGDVLMVSDVDEIIRASALKASLPILRPLQFKMSSYGSYVNAPSGSWSYAKAIPLQLFLGSLSPQQVRHSNYREVLDGGWHFSYLGGPAKICEKMDAFSHQEKNVQQFNNLETLTKNLAKSAGVFGGHMSFEKIDATWPEYLVKNQEKFRHLIGPPA